MAQNDLNEDYVSWVSIDVNDEGIVEKVRYRVEINIEEEKESNIEKIKQDISELNNTIKGMNVPVASEDLLSIYELTEDFWKQFANIELFLHKFLRISNFYSSLS